MLLYVDDWGLANVGYHRQNATPEAVTPIIDAIVAAGVQLNRMYAYSFCAPSRASLTSGRFPQNVNLHNIRTLTYDAGHPKVGGKGVPRNYTMLSQMLQQAGYWSAFAGK